MIFSELKKKRKHAVQATLLHTKQNKNILVSSHGVTLKKTLNKKKK